MRRGCHQWSVDSVVAYVSPGLVFHTSNLHQGRAMRLPRKKWFVEPENNRIIWNQGQTLSSGKWGSVVRVMGQPVEKPPSCLVGHHARPGCAWSEAGILRKPARSGWRFSLVGPLLRFFQQAGV